MHIFHKWSEWENIGGYSNWIKTLMRYGEGEYTYWRRCTVCGKEERTDD